MAAMLMICLGALIAGLCGLCTWNVALGPRGDQSYGLAPIVGGVPIAVGLALAMRGFAGVFAATPKRARLATLARAASEAVWRIGVGAPFMWIAGRGLYALVWSDEKPVGLRPFDPDSIAPFLVGLVFLVGGGWMSAVGIGRMLRAIKAASGAIGLPHDQSDPGPR